MSPSVTLGLEEEVFVCEPEAPSLGSLYVLARLMWSDPARHYARTASNFARGADLSQGLMSCVEVSTGVHDRAADLVDDLLARRGELAAAVGSRGLVVPVGHLLQNETPTNCAALQFHVGTRDVERAYRNLGYALPLLAALSVNSPGAGGERFGASYRMARGFAIGPLLDDPTARFQDLIVSKRLGTIEVRVLDPVADPARVRVLARVVEAVASLDTDLPFDRVFYDEVRGRVAVHGWVPELEGVYERISSIAEVPRAMLERSAADETWELYERHGLVGAYSALDSAWRGGPAAPRPVPPMRASAMRSLAGLAGYYVPKFPYVTWKYLREK